MSTPIVISILALIVALILPTIAIYKFFIERKIYADIHDEYDMDPYSGDQISKAIIVLSTKGSSPIYYTDFRVLQIDESGKKTEIIDINDLIFPMVYPGVISNSQPKIIKNHGYGVFPEKTEDGKIINYAIELMITGNEKTTIIPLRKRKWPKVEYVYTGYPEVEAPDE